MSPKKDSFAILFVCLGNICRSPAAEAILKKLASQHPEGYRVYVESCGLGGWHVGELPDPRMRQAAERRGVEMNSRAQRFTSSFFDNFDLILAADESVWTSLREYTDNGEHLGKICLMTAFSRRHCGQDVDDPYYGGEEGFDNVLDVLEDSCQGLLEHLVSDGH